MELAERPPATREALETWLIDRIASELRLAPESLDPHDPFARFGLDSVLSAELSADLEDWLGCELSPTLFWDLPSIRAIAEELGTRASRR